MTKPIKPHAKPKPTAPPDNRSEIVKELDAMVDAGLATKTTYSAAGDIDLPAPVAAICAACGNSVASSTACAACGNSN